ncbi:MAG: hypothetical protein U9Q83_03395, partial [Bacteroidota bacterium]|nr:hypothetical protein [Bacteroidota bacterium]
MKINSIFISEKGRIIIIIFLMLISYLITIFFHSFYQTGSVFTHSFYIISILAIFWFRKKGLFIS